MKVGELVLKLQALDQGLELIAYRENSEGFALFELEGVTVSKAVLERGDDGVVQARFDNEFGRSIAFLDLVAEI